MKIILLLFAVLACWWASPALADQNVIINTETGAVSSTGAPLSFPVSPSNPIPTAPGGSVYSGNGTLSVTTSSVQVSTLTVAAGGTGYPTTLTHLIAINLGNTDAAICPNVATPGATCTCPENGAATTNGLTLPANGGGYGIAVSVTGVSPTVVSCSGTVLVQFQW